MRAEPCCRRDINSHSRCAFYFHWSSRKMRLKNEKGHITHYGYIEQEAFSQICILEKCVWL